MTPNQITKANAELRNKSAFVAERTAVVLTFIA